MLLIEADAKAALRDGGLPVPPGATLYRADDPVTRPTGPVAIKAQLLAGGRGKGGLVRLSDADGAAQAVADVMGRMAGQGAVPLVLMEAQVDIARELYLAWRIDDIRCAPVLMLSMQGGVDIEANAESIREWVGDPLKPLRVQDLVPFLLSVGASGRLVGALARFAVGAYRVMQAQDATLLEINPLAVTSAGEVVAVDAKMTLDDNARPRHLEWGRTVSEKLQRNGMTPLEMRAADAGFTFVELEGDVALVTGGAGLGMAMVDLLADHGHRAANFVDAPGGSGTAIFGAMMRTAFERAERPDVKAIVLFLILSATSLKGAVASMLEILAASPPPKPLIVGMVATGAAEREMTLAEARQGFEALGHRCVSELTEAVAAVGALGTNKTMP